MRSGARRHALAFEQPVETVDPVTAATVVTWTSLFETLGSIDSLTGRELFAAQQVQAEVNTRINIRWRAGVDETLRIRELADGTIYDIGAVLPDKTRRREIWLLCTRRVSEGWRRGE